MPTPNALLSIHEQAGAGFIAYGPADGTGVVQVVDTFGRYEAEYAAIRKGVGLMDLPQRGVIELSGDDRLAFLHQVLTHDTVSMAPGEVRRAFLLNRQGRIMADLLVIHDTSHTYLEVDAPGCPQLVAELEKYLFSEDVQIHNTSDQYHCLALHGPAGAALIAKVAGESATVPEPMHQAWVTIGQHRCLVYRMDDTGSPGLHLAVPRDGAPAVYDTLARELGAEASDAAFRGRSGPIGWMAYNTARIEAGVPIYHIDFGPDSLPHETGVLDQAVSFTKGCYVGQEVVARMQNLGHPKKVLVGLRFNDDRLPITGASVYETAGEDGSPGTEMGAVTSSTLSPKRGGQAVALGMVRWDLHKPGTHVLVAAEGGVVSATVVALTQVCEGSRPGD